MRRSQAFFQWEWKVTKQETIKLQSQLSNYNKKQNLRKVERCGSHRFEEDREAMMGDDREKMSSASTSASAFASALCPLASASTFASAFGVWEQDFSPEPLPFPLHWNMLVFLNFCFVFLIFLSCFEFHLIFLFSFPS